MKRFRQTIQRWRSKTLRCIDCGCRPWDKGEDFYIRNPLWKLIVPEDGVICIGCFETRLGRKLVRTDFSLWFRNNRWFGDKRRKINNPPSARLADRLKLRA